MEWGLIINLLDRKLGFGMRQSAMQGALQKPGLCYDTLYNNTPYRYWRAVSSMAKIKEIHVESE
jgi:hypothetical protein